MIRFFRGRQWILWACSFLLIACSVLNLAPATEQASKAQEPYPVAMTTFRLVLPEPISSGEKVYLSVLDEMTGLAFNQQRFLMQAEDTNHFLMILPFPVGSVIKYRYQLERAYTVQEHTSDGRAVRYRLYHVTGPGSVNDTISRWTDTSFISSYGRITGVVTDEKDGKPIPNILVTAGGAQTITASDGSYLLEGLPPGTHTLVAYAMDGSYQTFQQGATVAENSATEASLHLRQASLVPISFIVSLPANTPSFATVHFAGNLIQLGDSFSDLRGGLNIASLRAPVLTRLPNGLYTITLTLPAGADIRYKYTLGDGIWNAEQTAQSQFLVRQLIVPEQERVIQDKVETWQSGQVGSVTFHVTVPLVTPAGETVSIQFNPGYGWTEPVPMWPAGSNQWLYTLYSPMEGLPELHYRYCRYDLCGSADEIDQVGSMATGRVFKPSPQPQVITDIVESWAWYLSPPAQVTVPSVTVASRPSEFMTGLEFQPTYTPTWGPDLIRGLENAAQLKAGWVILSPTWSAVRTDPPRLDQIPGDDLSFPEVSSLVLQARSRELNVALFPSIRFPGSAGQWTQQAPRDFKWWISWNAMYQRFLFHYADIASQNGASALILGGEWIAPFLPNGLLADGSPSNVPSDAEATWRSLLQEIRSRFNGILIWALPYPSGMKNIPAFLDAVDRIYLIWQAPLAQDGNATEGMLSNQAAALMDRDVLPLQQRFGKPVILGIDYPSVDGATTGCLPAVEGGCLDSSQLDRPNADQLQLTLDLDEQALAYNAIFLAVNERPWIAGVVSHGYFPLAPLQDKSTSVNGKPAAGVLWYWYPLFR